MKTFRLLTAALLLATSASAQRYSNQAPEGEYSPTVYLISVQETENIGCGCAAQEAIARNRAAVNNAIKDYDETHRYGFQQAAKPQFVFTTKDNRFSLALGGSVTLRAGYDFNGISDNIDFVPYDIPIPGGYNTRQKLMMDASTSRVFLKSITNSGVLGRVIVFMDADFRGGREGSYTPRLRSAYVSLGGFTLGRDVTTFCDLQAAPMTVDFRGPNAYNFNFATMIRYEVTFARDRMTFGIAAEMPNVSGTYSDYYTPLRQRVPDFPAYLQLAWGNNRESHIRVSGVIRDMYLHNARTGNNTTLLGWGAQFSGRIKVARPVVLFMNGIYGKGITPYIQDLTGSGLDFTPNPEHVERIQTTPMWAWQAAAQINLSRRVALSGGYSMVRVEHKNGFYADNEYRQGQYIFGNICYHLSSRFRFAAEYLYGTRKNMVTDRNHANRVNLMVQYSF
ncbi:DcaP family trimeric outer membrane transporter [uncultured Alistipes sp.]|uniref:DcaP family trimeric outer membrane transporter n=1 Tax=uncultured Alistipes sp. TaxID=538949 RepID=UPI0025947821|nr:DcaP family trimeric outer membrane transporter [uncultured Alistipes sp.]